MDLLRLNTKVNDKLSYCFTTNEYNCLSSYTVAERLDYMAENYPHKVAFIFNQNDGLKLTYEDIKNQAYLLAKNFLKLKLTKGDKIAYLLPNTHELLILYFATAIIGAVSVPLDIDDGIEELEHMFKKIEPKAIIFYNSIEYKTLLDYLYTDINESSKNEFKSSKFNFQSILIMVEHEHNIHLTNYNTALSYKALASKLINDDEVHFPYVDSDDTLAILFSSGTTSKPKGIVHTHFSILNNCAIGSNVSGIPKDNEFRHCSTLLMYHIGAIINIFSCLFETKRTFVFPSYKRDIKEIIQTIHKYRCSVVTLVPKILKNLLEHEEFKNYDLSCLKIIAVGGQMSSSDLILETKKKLNALFFTIGYGMTEIGIISANYINLSKFNGNLDNKIGQPYALTEAKIVDANTGKIQPLNVEGELHIRGYNVTKSYFNDEEITKKLIDKNDWLNTTDIFSMDKDGFLYFKSRSKEVITVKGTGRHDVYSSTIEECLQTHPRVKEAIVFGIPVNDYEDEICAWIKLNNNENESESSIITDKDIIEYCKDKLVDYKIPKFIKFVDNFPINKIGKYMRVEMQKQYKNELGF